MLECVKCGAAILSGAERCSGCRWPFVKSAWSDCERAPYRITLDTGCVNAKGEDPDLNTLEGWQQEGKLLLQRADAMLSELLGENRIAKAKSLGEHPELFALGISRLG